MTSAKNVLSNVSTRLVMFPLSFLSSVVVARLLGAEGKGVYVYVIVLSSFLIPLLSFGFGQGIRYFTANKKYAIRESGFTIFINAIILSLTISVALLVLWNFNWLGKSAELFVPSYIILLVMLVFFKTFVLFSQSLLNSDGQFVFTNKQNIINGAIAPILIIPFVFFFEDKVLGALLATGIAFIIMVINIVLFINKKYKPILRINNEFISDSYKYGIKGWLGYVAINANTRLDRFLLGMSTTASNLGNYSVATSFSELIWLLPHSVGPVFFNKVAETDDRKMQIELLTKINRLLFMSAIIIGGVFVVVLAKLIPLIYGEDYSDAVLPFMILVPGSIIIILTKSLTKLFSGTGKIIYSTYTQVGGAAFTIVLCFILIPIYGIIGAAVASTIGYSITSVIAVYFYKTKYGGSIRALLFINRNDFKWMIDQIKSLIKNK